MRSDGMDRKSKKGEPEIHESFVRIQRFKDETDEEWKKRADQFYKEYYKIPELQKFRMELTAFKLRRKNKIKLEIVADEMLDSQDFELNLRFPNDILISTSNLNALKLQIFVYQRNNNILFTILPQGTPNSHEVELEFGMTKTIEILIPKGLD